MHRQLGCKLGRKERLPIWQACDMTAGSLARLPQAASGCRAWNAALLRAATHAVHMHSGKRADGTGMAAGWRRG